MGQYLFPACNRCNLQLKPKKCKLAGKVTEDYFLPCVFHGLSNYDAHYVVKHFEKNFTMREKGQKVTYDDVKVIPLNGERFLQFQIGNIKFLDSFQFLSTSLENLVALLLKSGKENFYHTIKPLGDTEFTFAKGVFCYSYMTDQTARNLTRLDCLQSTLFTTHSTTNRFLTKTTTAPTKFGITTASKIYDNITTITCFRTFCCWQT